MTWNEETRILKADEGKWVTEDDINFAIEVKLAPSESVENWREVDKIPEPENPELADEYINTEPEE
jgi:hypothetical protein